MLYGQGIIRKAVNVVVMIIFIFSGSEGVVGIRGYRKQYIRRRDKTPPSWFMGSADFPGW